MPTPRPKPAATRITCAAALVLYLVARPDHYAYTSLSAGLLACGLVAAFGVFVDWVRLTRPEFDAMFFVGAAWLGALVVGLAPSPVTALWHPVLLAVGLSTLARRQVVAGRILRADSDALLLEVPGGRMTVDRGAHPELGSRSSLDLSPGATIALAARLGRRTRGEGPFRSTEVLAHGALNEVGQSVDALHRGRRSEARLAVGLVLASALLAWGAVSLDLTIGGACPL